MHMQEKSVPSGARPASATRPQVVLVLQGGGALGAYQAGVCHALQELGFMPDWVVGTSIGAINAALIAGSPRNACISRLRLFWERLSQPDLFDLKHVPDALREINSELSAWRATLGGVPGFFAPRGWHPFAFNLPVPPEHAGYYDITPLSRTLKELVDFDYLNSPQAMRLTVNAVRVESGQLVHFDNRQQLLGPEHVIASGALPPAFPPVRIDGELYWDGGLYSNTPLETVLADEPRSDKLCFMVDLWSSRGAEPRTVEQVRTREKDVLYASRSQRHIDAYLREHKLRRMLRSLRDRMPQGTLCAEEAAELDGLDEETTLHIVRIAYGGRDWQMASKDINFSSGSIEWRWEQGYRDAQRAVEMQAWLQAQPEGVGVVMHHPNDMHNRKGD